MRRSLPALLFTAAALLSPAAAHAATYTVNVTSDSPVIASTTLRQAITSANANAGADTINFNFGQVSGTSGAQMITPASQLPTITGQLTINGLGFDDQHRPLLVVRCSAATFDGLSVAAGAKLTVTGLSVAGCANDISVGAGAALSLAGSFLGFDLAGNVVPGSTNALSAAPATGSTPTSLTIGGPDPTDGNAIAGAAVAINAPAVGATTIQNNRIGTDLPGTQSAGSTTGVRIGGRTGAAAGDVTLAYNQIAGSQQGVAIVGPGVAVQGNRIGVNADSSAALPGTVGSVAGVLVTGQATGALVGGPDLENGNVIAGNGGDGIALTGHVSGVTIQSNLIGVAGDSVTALPNGGAGVAFTDDGSTGAPTGNVVQLNRIVGHTGGAGVWVAADGATGNQVLGDLISGASTGIDLGPAGITSNDPDDTDTGANGLQNFPVITGTAINSVTSSIDTTPRTAVRVQAFAATADGQSSLALIGESTVTTDETGRALIAIGITVDAGTPVIETATTADGTSEFSAPVKAATPSSDVDPGVLLPIVKPVVGPGGTLLPIVAPAGISPATGAKTGPGTALPVVFPDVGGLGLQAVKLTSDARHITLVLKNTYVANAVITLGGVDQAPGKTSGKKAKALHAVTHKIRAGKSATFTLTIPSATRATLMATIKKQGYAPYRPTLTVTNLTTKATKTQLVGIRAQR